ncbi:MAG: glycosyltransferase, partial [Acidobacteria bacterium]|nr:glycosyltransferase [Acidobacteriota bacterium]
MSDAHADNPPLQQDAPPPFLSVIVPVRNGADTIADCVASLQAQTYPVGEIIVVDNGSTDETIQRLEPFAVRLLREERRGSYVARNMGLRAARGSLVYFTDADCVLPPDTVARLVATLQAQGVAGVGGQVLPRPADTWVGRFGAVAGFLSYPQARGLVIRSPQTFLSGGLVTANILYRKDVLTEVGLFDETLPSGGDFDMCWRTLANGHALFFEPAAEVFHQPRLTLRQLCRQFYTYGRWQPRLLRRQPQRRNYIRIKTFITKPLEFSFAGSPRLLVDVDIIHWLLLLTVLTPLFYPALGGWSLLVPAGLLAGMGWRTMGVVRRTGNPAWLVVYPALHVVRSAAFSAGRIRGG